MTNKWIIEAESMVRTDCAKYCKEEIIYYMISYANLLLLDITVYVFLFKVSLKSHVHTT